MNNFVKASGYSFHIHEISYIDVTDIENLILTITLKSGKEIIAKDIEAIEIIMQLKPSLFEGKRMKYAKFTWVVHNMIGHPVMQILALFGLYKWAFYIHDITVPKPLGGRNV